MVSTNLMGFLNNLEPRFSQTLLDKSQFLSPVTGSLSGFSFSFSIFRTHEIRTFIFRRCDWMFGWWDLATLLMSLAVTLNLSSSAVCWLIFWQNPSLFYSCSSVLFDFSCSLTTTRGWPSAICSFICFDLQFGYKSSYSLFCLVTLGVLCIIFNCQNTQMKSFFIKNFSGVLKKVQ